jgi:hypothetical protein
MLFYLFDEGPNFECKAPVPFFRLASLRTESQAPVCVPKTLFELMS